MLKAPKPNSTELNAFSGFLFLFNAFVVSLMMKWKNAAEIKVIKANAIQNKWSNTSTNVVHDKDCLGILWNILFDCS